MKRQVNARMCFVCGLENPIGLRLVFEEDEERVWTEFTPCQEHQGWPGVLHGGLVCTLLDEVMIRAFLFDQEERWMVTAKMEVRYFKSVPLEQPLTLVGGVTKRGSRMIEAWGEIRLSDGSVAAKSKGVYLKAPPEMVEALKEEVKYWRVVPS